ncbi:MAG TPA: alpha/beta hydrolase [Longimicrobiaceae bacterium]|nr:alpha/beta hydrolase [Longimicrobiaceae bacterium]
MTQCASAWILLLLAGACSPPRAPMGADRAAGESVAVARDCRVPAPASPAAVHLERDVAYAAMGGQPLRLDLARPRGPGPHPLVVLIHGGGWSGGDKAAHHADMLLLAGQGYAAASVNYRLAAAPRNVFPAAVEDVRCAVRWLRSRAGEYDLDPSRVAAVGSSAGAHLAAMLGTAAGVPALDGACPVSGPSPEVSAVVAVAGPHDIRTAGALDPGQRWMVENFLGARPEDQPARALLASPAVHAHPGAPPFLLVHGTADDVVPVRQSRSMRDTLRAAGVPVTLIELPGVGHAVPEFSADPRFRVSTCTTLAFLRERLRPGS